MRFDLHRPCKNCPFRTDCPDAWLGMERAQEIVESLTLRDEMFPCHKTIEHDDETGEGVPTEDSRHCAGARILLEKSGHGPGQVARVAERLGLADPGKLDMEAPVYESFDAFVEHHSSEESGETCAIVGPGCEAPAGYGTPSGGVVRNYVEPGVTEVCEGGCGEYVCDSCCAPDLEGRICNDCAEHEREARDDDD